MAGIRGKKMPLPGELSIFTFRKGEVTGPPGGRFIVLMETSEDC
jgi:hypothetical protein